MYGWMIPMATINPLVVDKINSMDIDENRKKLIRTLFERQLTYGSDSKNKQYRVKNFREIILKEMRE